MRVGSVLLVALLGCSPGDWPDGKNHLHGVVTGDPASGAGVHAWDGDGRGIFLVSHDTSRPDGLTSLAFVPVGPDPGPKFGVDWRGRPSPFMADQASGNYEDALFDFYLGGESWRCQAGWYAPRPDQPDRPPLETRGTFTFSITAAAIAQRTEYGDEYVVHGTAHAVCPPGFESSARGTVTIDVTF